MIWIVITLLLVVAATGWYLFYRSVRVMFSFDQILGEVARVLSSYSQDLEKLSSGDLLLDHPEVRAFHRRNILVIEEINTVVEEIKKGRPETPKEMLPRPDVG